MRRNWMMFLFLAGVALAGASCSPSAESVVSVEGEVSRAFYNTMGLGIGTTSPFEYKVRVTIRNKGSSALIWDQIQADFYPERGRHLTQSTFAYDPEKGDDRTAYQGGANRPTELAAGEAHDLEVGTNGYTFDLLGQAGGKPLRFSVAVLLKGKTIAGPYVAPLPPINDLPSYEQALVGGGEKPIGLSFSR